MSAKKKVSVLMVTYNHGLFIEQAINSVLMQKTDFDFELIIGEDNSKDNTRSIVVDYSSKHPETIKAILNNENIGMTANWQLTFSACKGEYVAIIEGDDYWTDELKLQKQIDFLERNKEYSICYHKVSVVKYETGDVLDYSPAEANETSTIKDLARGNMIPTVSCVFRNILNGKLPEWFSKVLICDYCFHMLNAKNGKIKYINENMGVYRKHEQTSWSNLSLGTRWGQLFYTIQILKKEFTGDILYLLSMQQFFVLDAASSILSENEYADFEQKYKNEMANLAFSMSGMIYSNHINLSSLGSKTGINIAKLIRRFFSF